MQKHSRKYTTRRTLFFLVGALCLFGIVSFSVFATQNDSSQSDDTLDLGESILVEDEPESQEEYTLGESQEVSVKIYTEGSLQEDNLSIVLQTQGDVAQIKMRAPDGTEQTKEVASSETTSEDME